MANVITPVTGFPGDAEKKAGEGILNWLSNLVSSNKDEQVPAPAPQVEQQQQLPARGSYYLTPEGTPAFRGRSYTPEEINQLFPETPSRGPFSPNVDLTALAEKAGPIFNVADVKSGTMTTPQQPPIQQETPQQENPFQSQLSSYLNSLTENAKLQGTLTQKQLEQTQKEQAKLAEVRSPEHRKMNPIDWFNLGVRNLLAPLTLNPTMTKDQYLDRKFAADVGQTKEQIEEARSRANAAANAVEQQQTGISQGLKGLGGLQNLQQSSELYPLVKSLQESRVASAKQAPELAKASSEAMAGYRKALTDKLEGDLQVALQKAAILQYNREHPNNPIPLSGNNKAPVFDLGTVLNSLVGGGSTQQTQVPTGTSSDEEDIKALREAFSQ
jgi:hypothetical protein